MNVSGLFIMLINKVFVLGNAHNIVLQLVLGHKSPTKKTLKMSKN